jgi:hypothetical protein
MSHPKIVPMLRAMLILISLLGRAVPSISAAPAVQLSNRVSKSKSMPTFKQECRLRIFQVWP